MLDLPLPVLLLGAITGLTYGVLAVGLVLVWRSSRIINFAHGEIGRFGAAVLAFAVLRWQVPYWIAFPVALAAGAGAAAISEAVVVRRLRRAPALMSVVATLGLGLFLQMVSSMVDSATTSGVMGAALFPQPSFLPDFDVGALRVTPSYSAMLLLTPPLVFGISIFFRRSRYGLWIRASAANADAARTAGVAASRMSTLVWGISGALAAFTAILILPTQGMGGAQLLGPSLLLRALAAAVIARMTSLPIALGAGLGIGLIEGALLWNYPRGGAVEAVLFLGILIALLTQPRSGARVQDRGLWGNVEPWPPLPAALRSVWLLRHLGKVIAGAGFLLAVALTAVITNTLAVSLVFIVALTIVGLSLGIIAGLGGQLSLGQFALAGVGATASYLVTVNTGNFLLGFAAAGLAAVVASLFIGLPALRIQGMMLAVTTLGFALAADGWLLQQSWMLGEGVNPGRPIIGTFFFDTGRSYYLFSLVFLAMAFWLARNVWTGGLGRRLRAVRDNEDGARAFTIPATAVKLQSFAIAGFLAGIGGAVYGHAVSRVSADVFPVTGSIDVAALTILGGVGLLAGPLIGAFYIIGIPQLLPLDNAGLAATALGWLLIIMYFPGGLAQLIRPIRNRVVAAIARAAGAAPQGEVGAEPTGTQSDISLQFGAVAVAAAPSERAEQATPGRVILAVGDVKKHYGGIRAVDGVSFDVRAGQTVGLIGPNGAGKTTLFEVLAGFVQADHGRVIFDGEDVTAYSPEERGRRGLIRSFQDAALFPTMNVVEVVMLSLERAAPTQFAASVVGAHRAEQRKRARAVELVGMMGLWDYREAKISELSTGTRRITELACLIGLEPRLMLLDEPASGIAQRETEALGDLLGRVKDYLGATLIVIEHDIPLVSAISDHMIAMEAGRLLVSGSPENVRAHPEVVRAYLGGDLAVVERSGPRSAALQHSRNGTVRCESLTRSGAQCSRSAGPDGVCGQHRAQRAVR